jgi:hypothetical protein
METETIITLLGTLVGALGIKEVWSIWKKKIDVAAIDKRDMSDIATDRVTILEQRIDELYEENAELRSKVARLEERILHTAKVRASHKIPKKQEDNKNNLKI